MSLLEVVVAMLLAGIGLVATAGAALFAQRTLAGTALIDRITRDAATVLDSLAAHPQPASGERTDGGLLLRWTVAADSMGKRLRLEVQARHGPRSLRLTFDGRHAPR